MEKPVCERVVVVEGRYDAVRVSSALNAFVITTEGFGLFQNREKKALLRRLAEEKGLVTLLDPDGAGQVIRSHIQTITGGKGVVHLYVPPVKGKEARKKAPSKEGLIGVEGTDNDVIVDLFSRAGLLSGSRKEPGKRQKADLIRLGYSGAPDSKAKREAFAAKNRLPKNLSASALLEIINLLDLPLEE